jgi:ribosome-associated translation inhibitor RaiA
MQTPLDITFRGMPTSPALAIAVRTWAARLSHDHARILKVAVTVEQPHQHHRRGNSFEVHVGLVLAGREIAVSCDHVDPYVALGDAFRAARRQLREHVDMRREHARSA